MKKVLIIIPTYNERENIRELVTKLFALRLNLDVLVIDDGVDDADKIVADMQKENANLFLIKRSEKLGRGTAVREGLRYGLSRDYDLTVEMDADLSHDPADLPRMLERSASDTVVIGSRYVQGSMIRDFPARRLIFSKLSNFIVRTLLSMEPRDCTGGYRVYPRALISRLDLQTIKTPGHGQQAELAYRLSEQGARFAEVPITFVNRRLGVSKFSFHEAKQALLTVLRIRRARIKKESQLGQ